MPKGRSGHWAQRQGRSCGCVGCEEVARGPTFVYPKAVLERLAGQRAESGEPKALAKNTEKTLVETPVKTPVKILAILKDHPEYSLADVAAAIGLSLSAVERAAAKLVKLGKLRRVGPSKGGYWEILG
jgi:predicted HTH transcriptional regulator